MYHPSPQLLAPSPIIFFPSRTVFLTIGDFSIHWYGVMYLLAFVLAYLLLPRLQHYRNLQIARDDWATILSWAVVGVLVGGRLGYVFFYQPGYFLQHPEQILAVWRGGMASHGGFLGVAIALFLITRRMGVPLLALLDVAVVPVALGLALGRMGNFINLELYGTVTDLPWGIAIPGVEGLRHPTQIYAVLKDLLLAGCCFWHLGRSQRSGSTTGLFLVLYAVLRFTVEFYRVQEHAELFGLSRGQLLTVPIAIVGVSLLIHAARDSVKNN